MSYLNTSYKLGSIQAIEDFESWIQNSEYDNPTEAPPKMAAALAKLSKAIEKTGKYRIHGSKPASRRPTKTTSRYHNLKKKLARKKRR